MDHDEVIKRVGKIVPEIQQTRDPQGALLKLARDENLSPAQLERIAQMFNAAKTLTYYDKTAGSRGGSFSLVDTEQLLDAYTAHRISGVPKAHSDIDDWLDKPASMCKAACELDPDDINSWIESPTYKSASQRFPLPYDTGLEQYTEEVDAEQEAMALANAYERSKEASRVTLELIGEIRDMHEEAIREKVAYLTEIPNLQWDVLEEDVQNLTNVPSDVIDMLALHMKSAGFEVERFDPYTAVPQVMLRDRTGLLPLIREVSEYYSAVKNANVLEREEKKDKSVKQPDMEPKSDDKDVQREGQEADFKRPSGWEEENEETQDKLRVNVSRSFPSRNSKDIAESSLFDSILSGLEAGAKFKGPKKMPEPWKDYLGISTQELLNPGTNQKQKLIDSSLEDDNSIMMLQRFMMSDPIISEADPEMVISLFNTMRNINPEFAADPNRMRLALRDAIQYESLPMHTISDLTSLRSEGAKAEQSVTKNRDAEYETSGRKVRDSRSKDDGQS